MSEGRDFWLERSKLKWRARWRRSKWKNKVLLWNTPAVFELRPSLWEKLYKVPRYKLDRRLYKMFEITCLDKCEEAFFFLIYRDIRFSLWSALFLRLLGLLTLLVNMFRAANLHGRVLVRVKGWYVEGRGAQSWFQRCVDWFGLWMRPSSGAHTKRGVKCVSVHVSGDAPRADACTLIRSGARWRGLQRADELKFTLARHLTLQPLQYASYFSAVPLLVLPFSLFFIIAWCCPFQQRPTGSHSLPNYLHIKQGSPQRRRP